MADDATSAADSTNGHLEPEVRLWRSVVALAWSDAFGVRGVNRTDRLEAEAFLMDADGPWARSRGLICDGAGVCPDRLRERAIQRRDELLPESESSLWRPQAAAYCLAQASS